LLVFTGTDHVVKRSLYRNRLLGVFNVDLGDLDSGAIRFHLALGTQADFVGYISTALGQYPDHGGAANHVTDGRFNSLVQTTLWITHTHRISQRIRNHVLYGNGDGNDVLVSRQHVTGIGSCVNTGDVDLLHLVDQRRIPAQTWQHHFFTQFTKTQHYTSFGFVDSVKTHRRPDHRSQHNQYAQQASR